MRCPKCKQPLTKDMRRFVCPANHSYDIAKEGYVNLLQKNSTNHGDNKQMVAARSHFLNQNYYQPLAERLIALLFADTQNTSLTILDLGCGQGYYTNLIQHAIPSSTLIGVDISKEAIAYASKQNKQIQYIVASNAILPLADHSIDVALCLFSFVDYEEAKRVLKPGGKLLVVNPHQRHLYELKSAVYETPYLNEIKVDKPDGFALVHQQELTYPFTLPNNQAILELFAMTPYSFKTRKEDADKLKQLSELSVHASFSILIYQK